MSKSSGGGGFKGGDKGSSGSCKVITKAVPLEQRLDSIPDGAHIRPSPLVAA